MLYALQSYSRFPLAIGTLTLFSKNNHSTSQSKFSRRETHPYPLPPPPEEWPQRPLWVRPTPGSNTRILRIRRMDSKGKTKILPIPTSGAVPVNSGAEEPGQSSLIDFESDHFEGTMLFLLRGAPSVHTTATNKDEKNYFDDNTQTFQVVVKGRFKQPSPLQDVVAGQVFRRPAGKQLPHWIMHNMVMPLINKLAPHNAIDLECQRPYYWAPIASAAQNILVLNQPFSNNTPPTVLEMERELHRTEPHGSDPRSIVYPLVVAAAQEKETSNLIKRLTGTTKSLSLPPPEADDRANNKARKKILRKYLDAVEHKNEEGSPSQKTICFDPNKQYLFGIYNHWIQFNDPTRKGDLALDLGIPLLRHIALAPCTDGQPVVLMAAVLPEKRIEGEETLDLGYLWSLEVWHESLYPIAASKDKL